MLRSVLLTLLCLLAQVCHCDGLVDRSNWLLEDDPSPLSRRVRDARDPPIFDLMVIFTGSLLL